MPEQMIIIAATRIGVIGANDAAMNPESIAGIAWASACTDELIPMISPLWSGGAALESKLFIFAIVSPVQIEKNGGIKNNSHACFGKKYAITIIPAPINE